MTKKKNAGMWKEEDGPAWTGWSPMKVGASVLACPRHVTAGVASPGIALGPAHGSRCPADGLPGPWPPLSWSA